MKFHAKPIRSLGIITIACVIAGSAQVSIAQSVMYGSTGRNSPNPGAIVTVDEATGAVTLVGLTGRTVIAGLAFNSLGDLYGISCDNALGPEYCSLIVIDPDTGAEIADIGYVTLGGVDEPHWIPDLAFQPGTDTLYATHYYLGLVNIDTATAAITVVNPALPGGNSNAGGLTFTPDGRLFFASSLNNSTDFWELDPATGGIVSTIPLSIQVGLSGLGSRPADGQVFGTTRPWQAPAVLAELVTLDVATGTITTVGIPNEYLSDVDFRPGPQFGGVTVPAGGPVAWALTALLLLGAGMAILAQRAM
jgi:hypothetical protein